jgi:hypothetical protein
MLQEAIAMENINNGNEISPPAHIGFCRWLAAMYCHTGAHIVAAPMAHYMALYGSRFRYSHCSGYFPIHGIENFIMGNKTIMQYKKIGNTKLPMHRCMNYIFRPKSMEDLCTYEFFAKVQDIRLSGRFKKEENLEMRYLASHIGHMVYAPKYYNQEIIPYFNWNYLPSTNTFLSSLYYPINLEDSDYTKKEEYCKKFLILFFPFRNKDDLLLNESYTKRMQEAIKSNIVSPAMIEIANNIQTIHNSLNSPMVENILTSSTYLEDPEDYEMDEGPPETDMDDILLRIGTSLASSLLDTLTEEASDLNPISGHNVLQPRELDKFGDVLDAFEMEEENHINTNENNNDSAFSVERFSVNTSKLNQLIFKTFLSRKDMDERRNATSQEEKDNDAPLNQKWKVDATGTWQSIVAWSKVNGLDADQQTAFEILAATFVLTFHLGQTKDEIESGFLKEEFNSLCKLARKDNNDSNPLRLFVTGPAGAGKCKFQLKAFVMFCSKLISSNPSLIVIIG